MSIPKFDDVIAKFKDVPDMKRTVKASGSLWFEPSNMEMFHSKIETPLIQGSFFVTSEYQDDPAETKYSARYFSVPEFDGGMYNAHDIGEFNSYESVAEARAAIFTFITAQSAMDNLVSLLHTVGMDYVSDDADGKTYLTTETKYLRGDVLYMDNAATAAVGIRGQVIALTEFSSPRGFANYIKGWVIDKGEFKGADK